MEAKERMRRVLHGVGLLVDYAAFFVSSVFTIRLFVSFSKFAEEDRLGVFLLAAIAIVFEIGKVRTWMKSHEYREWVRRWAYRAVAIAISVISLMATAGQALVYVAGINKVEVAKAAVDRKEKVVDLLSGVASESLSTLKGLDENYLTWKEKVTKQTLEIAGKLEAANTSLEEAEQATDVDKEMSMFLILANQADVEPGAAALWFWIAIAAVLEILAYLMTYPYKPKMVEAAVKAEEKPKAEPAKASPPVPRRPRVQEQDVAPRVFRAEKPAAVAPKETPKLEVVKDEPPKAASRRDEPPVSIRTYELRSKPAEGGM